jgi:hypothetical protein
MENSETDTKNSENIENLLSSPSIGHEEKEILRELQKIIKEREDWIENNFKLVMPQEEIKDVKNRTVMRITREKEWYENIFLNKSLIMNDIILLNYSDFISFKQKIFLAYKYMKEIETNQFLLNLGQTEELVNYIGELYLEQTQELLNDITV